MYVQKLPNFPACQIAHISSFPSAYARYWLDMLPPYTSTTHANALAKDFKDGSVLLRFEVYDFYNTDLMTGMFRTGTVSLMFSPDGVLLSSEWSPSALYPEAEGFLLRPLWLPVQLWDLIPFESKVKDPDFALDPFEGAADFKPAADSVNGGLN